jgi:hypothetical protein
MIKKLKAMCYSLREITVESNRMENAFSHDGVLHCSQTKLRHQLARRTDTPYPVQYDHDDPGARPALARTAFHTASLAVSWPTGSVHRGATVGSNLLSREARQFDEQKIRSPYMKREPVHSERHRQQAIATSSSGSCRRGVPLLLFDMSQCL